MRPGGLVSGPGCEGEPRKGSGRRRKGWSWRKEGPAPPGTTVGNARQEGPLPCGLAGIEGEEAAGGTVGLRELNKVKVGRSARKHKLY